MSRRSTHGAARQYPRTARLNELLREILAEELERLDDGRLELLTVTSVEIDGDLRHAAVYYDSLDGEEGDEQVLGALGELRWRLQAAIAREARIKRTPELSFAPDPGVRAGARIEALLADIPPSGEADAHEGGEALRPDAPSGGTAT
jgi:ribosome-binding factor A